MIHQISHPSFGLSTITVKCHFRLLYAFCETWLLLCASAPKTILEGPPLDFKSKETPDQPRPEYCDRLCEREGSVFTVSKLGSAKLLTAHPALFSCMSKMLFLLFRDIILFVVCDTSFVVFTSHQMFIFVAGPAGKRVFLSH